MFYVYSKPTICSRVKDLCERMTDSPPRTSIVQFQSVYAHYNLKLRFPADRRRTKYWLLLLQLFRFEVVIEWLTKLLQLSCQLDIECKNWKRVIYLILIIIIPKDNIWVKKTKKNVYGYSAKGILNESLHAALTSLLAPLPYPHITRHSSASSSCINSKSQPSGLFFPIFLT